MPPSSSSSNRLLLVPLPNQLAAALSRPVPVEPGGGCRLAVLAEVGELPNAPAGERLSSDDESLEDDDDEDIDARRGCPALFPLLWPLLAEGAYSE